MNRCPKCGDKVELCRGDFSVLYVCGTSITHGKIEEGKDCLRRQRDELAMLLPICKRLIEWDNQDWGDLNTLVPIMINLRGAYKALEKS